MSEITVAVTQMACSENIGENIEKAESLIKQAAGQGARIILLQELFLTPYFCKDEKKEYFELAREVKNNPVLSRMSELARDLSVVLPVSFYERAGNVFFNSIMMIDADGTQMGVYRKTHIPHAPAYHEKYYFAPGDTGFKVWPTQYGNVGAGICWDQWFPECARAMALTGADILLYPTAIGTSSYDNGYDYSPQWQHVMQGHAAANTIPVCASNRVGLEKGESCELNFFGRSFIADESGTKVAEADRREETVLTASFDFEEIQKQRDWFALFRDRRPEMYDVLLTLDGRMSNK
ncbi:MAG: N-carbamoylputrescine amidase [Desulfobacteraceae bacterium 4572_123]|nr:MAG: N-carbamoylputrescine amidase [Desulfobacteraceae bacterium 4572_123]